jgi:hypothetical protein
MGGTSVLGGRIAADLRSEHLLILDIVGLKRLHLFHGTPMCSWQIPILLPTAIGDNGIS